MNGWWRWFRGLIAPAIVSGALAVAGPAMAGLDFAPRINLRSGAGAIGVALGDLNGDGVADLVVCASGSDAVVIHRGLGGGQYAKIGRASCRERV